MRATYAKESDIPEGLRDEYVDQDGAFVLKIDGDHPIVMKLVADANEKVTAAQREAKKSIGEYRDNNIALLQLLGVEGFDAAKVKIEALKSIDPKAHQEALDRIAELEKGGVSKKEDVQALVAKQVEAAVGPYRQQVEEMKAKERRAAEALAKKEVESALTAAAVRVGVQDSAVEDFVARGSRVFSYEEGRIVAKDSDGEIKFSQRRPADPLDVNEWAEGLQEQAPHIFKPSQGGGAGGSRGGGTTKHVNAFDPLEFGRNAESIASGETKVTR